MNISERFTIDALEKLRGELSLARGNEVLCIGLCDGTGKILELSTAARGDVTSVPALFPFMEKGNVVIHNHPSGNLTPSPADLQVASRLGNDGIGFYIVDNEATEVYAAVEPLMVKPRTALDRKTLMSLLDNGGSLEKILPGFEPRQSQMTMLSCLIDCFNEDTIGLVEAGTGVGKSFAYLVPALTWASQNEERVVISTSTINLQQQLLEKDIPIVKRVLGSAIKTVLVKGRGNYLCLRRLKVFREESSLFLETHEQLESITEWADCTKTGDRQDLAFLPDELLWSQICSEADACLGIRCAQREGCFVIKARREAASARVLLVNHHLLFSDVALRHSLSDEQGKRVAQGRLSEALEQGSVLPPFARIIFDEAHNMEAAATSFFSEKLNRSSLFKQLALLYRKKKRKILGLGALFEKRGVDKTILKELPELNTRVTEAMVGLEETAASAFESNNSLRLKDLEDGIQEEITGRMSVLRGLLVKLIQVCGNIADDIEEDSDVPELYELAIVRRRLSAIVGILNQFVDREEYPNHIFWMEQVRLSGGDKIVNFFDTPLDLSDLMRECVFNMYGTVFCTSASLAVRDSFDHFKSRIGLEGAAPERIVEEILPSPFPYKKNVLLAVPMNGPLPTEESYVPYIGRLIFEILTISEGRALVLFTSFDMLNKIYATLSDPLEQAGIPVLKQGSLDRALLLKDFTSRISSVLFATESFWEGIDAPGETCSIVVICRLPFKVPVDPIIKSRVEALEAKGRNSFLEYSVPDAALKLKQGFGRLIRRTDDRGIVVILDSRILKKSYGRLLLDSLPETQTSFKQDREMLKDIERFLYPGK